MSGQGVPPAALQSQAMPPMDVSQGMIPPALAQNLAGQDTSSGPAAGGATQGQSQMPLKFDISQILSVIRNNMSATQGNE